MVESAERKPLSEKTEGADFEQLLSSQQRSIQESQQTEEIRTQE